MWDECDPFCSDQNEEMPTVSGIGGEEQDIEDEGEDEHEEDEQEEEHDDEGTVFNTTRRDLSRLKPWNWFSISSSEEWRKTGPYG